MYALARAPREIDGPSIDPPETPSCPECGGEFNADGVCEDCSFDAERAERMDEAARDWAADAKMEEEWIRRHGGDE